MTPRIYDLSPCLSALSDSRFLDRTGPGDTVRAALHARAARRRQDPRAGGLHGQQQAHQRADPAEDHSREVSRLRELLVSVPGSVATDRSQLRSHPAAAVWGKVLNAPHETMQYI